MELEPVDPPSPPKPLPNSYWVLPGRWLAGEYPGARSALEASNRLQALLSAGLNAFIDLTESQELPPYQDLLAEADVRDLEYHRMPIADHGVPQSAAQMVALLDLIDRLLAQGRCLYLHCRAGIGRTNLVVGCHLVRGGLTGEAALERLQLLWQHNERARFWPSVPETDAQVRFVRNWQEAGQGSDATAVDRARGALVGLAVGEALGLLATSVGRDAATFLAALTTRSALSTGPETAMTVAALESLLERQGHDPKDQLRRYQEWLRAGNGDLAPAELKRALAVWQWSPRRWIAGSHDPKNLDPHTLARTLASALYSITKPDAAIDLAAELSRTTLQSPLVLDLCRMWAAMLLDALRGEPQREVLRLTTPLLQQLRQRTLRPELGPLLSGDWTALGSNAPAVSTTALRAVQATPSFKEAVLQAVSAGRQRATCGALAGALAGALYGVQQIPVEWRARLAEDAVLSSLAERCAVRSS